MKWGIYDPENDLWFGDAEGPFTFDSEEKAEGGLIVVRSSEEGRHCIVKEQPADRLPRRVGILDTVPEDDIGLPKTTVAISIEGHKGHVVQIVFTASPVGVTQNTRCITCNEQISTSFSPMAPPKTEA